MAASDAAPGLVNLSGLMDDAKCFAFVRQHRWPEGVRCPGCDTAAVIRDGCDDSQPHRQRYRCKGCARRFDDLTGTVLAGHHQPLRVWVLCLYFMGLNLSNRQIAQELGLDGSDAQAMAGQLRRGLAAKAPPVRLEGEVEIDEVYVVAGRVSRDGVAAPHRPGSVELGRQRQAVEVARVDGDAGGALGGHEGGQGGEEECCSSHGFGPLLCPSPTQNQM